jgi:hypothetical protein
MRGNGDILRFLGRIWYRETKVVPNGAFVSVEPSTSTSSNTRDEEIWLKGKSFVPSKSFSTGQVDQMATDC